MISRYPIVHRTFYMGPWDTKHGRMIDYSLVPTHFDVDHGMVYLHVEHQNRWVDDCINRLTLPLIH